MPGEPGTPRAMRTGNGKERLTEHAPAFCCRDGHNCGYPWTETPREVNAYVTQI